MKISVLSAAALAAAVLGGSGSSAFATTPVSPTYTYEFTSSDSDTRFDGTTITIDGTGSVPTGTFTSGGSPIASFDLLEDGTSYTGGYVFSGNVAGADTTGWDGTLDISVTGAGMIDFGANYGADDYISVPQLDPFGTWNLVTPAPVPDEAETFQLLLAGMGAVGMYYRSRRRAS